MTNDTATKWPTKNDLPLMPSWPGLGLVWPHGFPMRAEDFNYCGQRLSDIIMRYYQLAIKEDVPPLSHEELELLRQYLIYFVHAPCFNSDAQLADYNAPLRAEAWRIEATTESISDFLMEALNYGLDPF